MSAEAIEESQRKTELQESSSVDLSSRPSYHGAEFDSALEAPSGGVGLGLGHRPELASRGGRRRELDRPSAGAGRQLRRPWRPSSRPAGRPRTRLATKAADAKGPGPPGGGPAPGRAGPEPRRGALIGASVLGLLLGASGVLAAYFGGVLPNRKAGGVDPPTAPHSADAVQLKQQLTTAQNEAAECAGRGGPAMATARKAAEGELQRLTTAKTAAEDR